ncbi:hypothetical protein K2P47_00880 [Patescibacteria group bacterium]|nr:hypothetical protein [Patescibacteria group bacterium]
MSQASEKFLARSKQNYTVYLISTTKKSPDGDFFDLKLSESSAVLEAQGHFLETYFLYDGRKCTAAGPAIFPREEKIGTEIQNCRYALFFIPQRNVPILEVLELVFGIGD